MPSEMLFFDNTGGSRIDIHVPSGKRLYFTRTEEKSGGSVTIRDYNSERNYTIPNGKTIGDPNIRGDVNVSLAFIARTNEDVEFVGVEITDRRS